MLGVRIIELGEIRENNHGTVMKIISIHNRDDIDVMFLDDFNYVKKHVMYSCFKNGVVKNPYDKTIHGVGYLGVGNYSRKKERDNTLEYITWYGMLERCYCEKKKNKHSAYYHKVTVCKR